MSTKTSHRRSSAELKALAFRLVDDIETIAQRYISHGYSRRAAINLAVRDLAA